MKLWPKPQLSNSSTVIARSAAIQTQLVITHDALFKAKIIRLT